MENKAIKSHITEELPKEIPNYWSGNCFGCSPSNPYGLQMKINLSKNGCFSYLRIPDYFCGFDGIVHGGIIASILDEISAWTLVVHLSKIGVTKEVSIQYLKPVATNLPIIAEGEIISCDNSNVLTKASIKNTDGIILAECKSNWIIPDLKTLARLTGKELSKIESMFNRVLIPIKRIRNEI